VDILKKGGKGVQVLKYEIDFGIHTVKHEFRFLYYCCQGCCS